MEYKDVPKFIRAMIRNPSISYYMILNGTRSAFHPLERHLLGGLSFAPRSISIMITDRCNLRCRMCHFANCESPVFSLNQAGFMSLELFRRILDTCPGKPLIGLTGGEPLLHPQVLEFIQEVKQRGFFCSLTTNGTFLSDKAEQLCESKLDLLVVSVDGDQSIHDQIRGQGVFERAVAGIQKIMRIPTRPLVGMSTAIMDINFKDLEKSFDVAEALGVDILNFSHLWIQTDQMILDQQRYPRLPQSGRVLWKINTQEIDSHSVFDNIHSIKKKNRCVLVNEYPELNREQTRTYYQQPEQLVKVRSTRCAWQVTRIYPNGEVGICREYHAGNVQSQPLRDIWNNQKYRNFRRYLRDQGTCPICSRCCWVFSKM